MSRSRKQEPEALFTAMFHFHAVNWATVSLHFAGRLLSLKKYDLGYSTCLDYRTELNNVSVQAGFKLEFQDVFEGPQHNGTWTSTAFIDGVASGQGSAKSVRPAREEASRQTLILLGRA
ncbi:uncharacterized protein EV420DRAFT_1644983 [Desarmillaria tabescens]|uniref:DRBM domain-containing protein n=1 Tax=Armillaria tabescens TaxID=1929756 RepID=A0AA39K699_ARMTA|nr:uncharacterized protein EV420DRAFT_1644983 [Desarmillaria tabescens]KAK0455347.1 hypothetical protein EV420DRAFT_1644983 [Desarmillaria tabescens]